MNIELLEEQKKFYEFIINYEYINEQGLLELEAFCVNLSICFICDGIKDKSSLRLDAYKLLIDIISSYTQNHEIESWVKTQKLSNWTPKHAYIYPNKYRTYIHLSGILLTMHEWIYQIGHTLIGIPEPNVPSKYFDWVKPEWIFVYTFINGFHNYITELQKKIDKEQAKESGYSYFEALHRAVTNDIDYDQAVNEIKKRNSAHDEALKRINIAMDSGFHLEAITLQECLISNCLYNYLQSIPSKNINSLTLNNLILLCKSKIKLDSNICLLNEIDKWRSKRNTAIHGFIKSKAELLSKSQIDFDKFSKETSQEGQVLCKKICEWYLNESINFIPTEFDIEEKKVN